MLSASLSLVKPAGMTPKEAADWLNAAFDALSHLPFHIFAQGIRAARLTCDHPAKIVPAVVASTRDALDWHGRPKVTPLLRLVPPARTLPDEPLPEPETLMPSLQRIGLMKGFLVERDGRLAWASDEGTAA